jgi:hypothetical protein
MRQRGQGRHLAVSVLELDGVFDVERFRRGVAAFGAAYPVLFGEIYRDGLWSVPEWRGTKSGELECVEHSEGAAFQEVALRRLSGDCRGHLCLDVIPRRSGATILMTWNHLLWDGRGAELTLAEIGRFAEFPDRVGMPQERWGFPAAVSKPFLEKLKAVRPFTTRHAELREHRVVSIGAVRPVPSQPRFEILRFNPEESGRIRRKAELVTGGIFSLPYFLAVTMRAHAAVLRKRGLEGGAFECAVSTQLRKRGTMGALFQNQVSQMFFSLSLPQTEDLAEATHALHRQFERANREGIISGFLIMVNWMRRLPLFLYKLFLSREASGRITSFYYAHTGAFMPGIEKFGGAKITDGWHVPTVFQPPGTGLFFSERSGCLTASLCWRTGVLDDAEVAEMLGRVRADLLEETAP